MKRCCTSKYEGVKWSARAKKWVASISEGPRSGGRHHHLGVFDDEEEAARAYDRAALYLGRDPAKCNFPPAKTKPVPPADLTHAAWQRRKEQTTSRYTGVLWDPRRGVWRAMIFFEGRRRRLGGFDDEAAAARAYDDAALRLRGDAQRPQWINFPEERSVARKSEKKRARRPMKKK